MRKFYRMLLLPFIMCIAFWVFSFSRPTPSPTTLPLTSKLNWPSATETQQVPITPTHYLSICSVFKDEEDYIDEWIHFHRLVGVEKFFLYDHHSTDNSIQVLKPYVDLGWVVLEEAKEMFVDNIGRSMTQANTFKHCLEKYGKTSRWMMFIDMDEFAFSPEKDTIPMILKDYENYPGLIMRNVFFGSSGHLLKPDGLVIENYLYRAHLSGGWSRVDDVLFHVKSIVDPSRARVCSLNSTRTCSHYFCYNDLDDDYVPYNKNISKEYLFSVNERFEEITFPTTMGLPYIDRIRFNHYKGKSYEDYTLGKMKKGTVQGLGKEAKFSKWGNMWRQVDLNDVRDERILRFVPAVRKKLKLPPQPLPLPPILTSPPSTNNKPYIYPGRFIDPTIPKQRLTTLVLSPPGGAGQFIAHILKMMGSNTITDDSLANLLEEITLSQIESDPNSLSLGFNIELEGTERTKFFSVGGNLLKSLHYLPLDPPSKPDKKDDAKEKPKPKERSKRSNLNGEMQDEEEGDEDEDVQYDIFGNALTNEENEWLDNEEQNYDEKYNEENEGEEHVYNDGHSQNEELPDKTEDERQEIESNIQQNTLHSETNPSQKISSSPTSTPSTDSITKTTSNSNTSTQTQNSATKTNEDINITPTNNIDKQLAIHKLEIEHQLPNTKSKKTQESVQQTKAPQTEKVALPKKVLDTTPSKPVITSITKTTPATKLTTPPTTKPITPPTTKLNTPSTTKPATPPTTKATLSPQVSASITKSTPNPSPPIKTPTMKTLPPKNVITSLTKTTPAKQISSSPTILSSTQREIPDPLPLLGYIYSPRLPVFAPLFRKLAGASRSCCIIILTNPAMLASYYRSGYTRDITKNTFSSVSDMLLSWEKYTLSSIKSCQGTPIIVVREEELISFPYLALLKLHRDMTMLLGSGSISRLAMNALTQGFVEEETEKWCNENFLLGLPFCNYVNLNGDPTKQKKIAYDASFIEPSARILFDDLNFGVAYTKDYGQFISSTVLPNELWRDEWSKKETEKNYKIK